MRKKTQIHDLWQTKDYIVSADQLLASWAKKSYSGLPIVVIPSTWLSIILRFSGRTNNDYRSYCLFMGLRQHRVEDEDIIINPVKLLNAVSERTTERSIKETIINEIISNKDQYFFESPKDYTIAVEKAFESILKEKADEVAVKVFAENLRQLLLAAPIGQKRVLALDPGFRTGCKVVILNEYGALLHNETIFPHPPQSQIRQASNKIRSLVNAYKIDVIAIGNGTAGRETEDFIHGIVFDRDITAVMVNESGASIYSASKVARDEFPDYDIAVRGAVSIGRRLMDPLAELVKIDPKSIGVGQYQHDVNQKLLTEELAHVVESCVNAVGVELNSASEQLLSYVSGVGPQLASNIVKYRNENGGFSSRKQLLKVPRLGEKAYEQCAGFMRIFDGKNPLEVTSVHPESYDVAEKLLETIGFKTKDLLNKESLNEIKVKLAEVRIDKIAKELAVGEMTLKDIIDELSKPGRDPRDEMPKPVLRADVLKFEDLREGQILTGTVRNVIDFGAFVDVGVKHDGLVHISEMSDKFVKNPSEIVSVGDIVKVKVIAIDMERQKVKLSMKV